MNEMDMIDLKFQAARKAEARVKELQSQIEQLLESNDPDSITQTDKLLDQLHDATDVVVRSKQPAPRLCGPIVVDPATGFPMERTGQTPGISEWRSVNGEPVKVLGKSARLSDLSSGGNGLSLGRVIRSLARGEWDRDSEAERRAMSTTVNTGGGVLVPAPISDSVIDLARGRAVLIQAGAQLILQETGDTLTIAKVVSDPAISLVAENDAFAESAPVLGAMTVVPKKLGCLVRMSRELASDAPNAVSLIENVLARALAASIDARGLTALVDSGSVLDGAAVAGWSNVIDALGLIRAANHEPNGLILPPALDLVLNKQAGTSNDHFIETPACMANIPRFVTTGLAATEGLLGDFSKLLLVLRRAPEIAISQDAAFDRDQIMIRCSWRGEYCISDAGAFCALKS